MSVGEERSAAYHPDLEVNAGIVLDALDAERVDLAAGYAPRFWRCPDCGHGHARGHFQVIGIHRCLYCGYAGDAGTTHTHNADGRLVR